MLAYQLDLLEGGVVLAELSLFDELPLCLVSTRPVGLGSEKLAEHIDSQQELIVDPDVVHLFLELLRRYF